ncbi:hypothetical protein Vadar_024915 [Vaccinium darrowii]|uniref:Uncharacterized protein n=1 Tax=Vaccinium darrowii TaxID=229202 RepID=A0ACB7ZML5_9ERIC|nr:hypothetical protein Vadar_024915 [Vaccinium darrowii]
MATSGNRSPSPISSRPNPNSRTPEANSTMRRSYSGNPFAKPSVLSNARSFPPVAPANSPVSDLGGRHSISKDPGVFSRVHDEKENEKDQNLKPVKVRSPAVVKGTKNFMSPTISAASKINASSKKKVLGERNETVRTSISFSDWNSPLGSMNNCGFKDDELDSKEDSTITKNAESFNSNVKSVESSDVGFNQNNKAEDSNSSAIRKSKKVSFLDFEVPLSTPSFSEALSDMNPLESDLTSAVSDCEIKPFGSSISPIIAPLDADPSRPYDPKTNYLSPRPQFLHYKPNPRIEVYLHKEKGIGSSEQGKRLEESFISESFSDTDTTSEEIDSENSNKESEDDSSLEVVNEVVEPQVYEPKPNSNSEDDSSIEVVNEVVEPQVYEPKPNSNSEDDSSIEVVNEVVEPQVYEPKPNSNSEDDSSIEVVNEVVEPQVYEPKPNSNLFDTHIAKETVVEKGVLKPRCFTRSKSAALILVLLIACFSVSVKESPQIAEFSKASVGVFSRNLKQWSSNSVVYLVELISSLDEGDKLGPVQFSNLTSLLEDPFTDGYPKVDHIEEMDEEIDEQEVEVEEELLEEELENEAPDDYEASDSEEEHEVIESDCSELALDQEKSGIPSLSSNDHEFKPVVEEILEIKSESVETREVQVSDIESLTVEPNPESHLETRFGDVSESVDNSLDGSENIFSQKNMQKISLLVSALVGAIAVAVVFYLKHRGITPPSGVVLDSCSTKKLTTSSPPPSQLIWPADVEVVEESCPSEMSSFQKSMSYSKRGVTRGDNEIQSQEKKQRTLPKRRESLASSSDYSTGSPSYGSFTTYEKIPIKHGSGEEEIVTPVRRSSRFKSQVTSP